MISDFVLALGVACTLIAILLVRRNYNNDGTLPLFWKRAVWFVVIAWTVGLAEIVVLFLLKVC